MCTFQRLIDLMEVLRSENGCPWDRSQTLDTLREYLLEESYEVIEKIHSGDLAGLREELGDLLFEIVFLAKVASDMGVFNMFDVIDEIHNKMVRRHPHVFGTTSADTSEEVSRNWHRIKEREENKRYDSILDGIPRTLPALFRSYKMTKRAARVNFDWETIDQVLLKMKEEISEFLEASSQKDRVQMESEVGDILFVAANIARFVDINPEIALQKANERFEKRFRYMEHTLKDRGEDIHETPIGVLEALWENSKKR